MQYRPTSGVSAGLEIITNPSGKIVGFLLVADEETFSERFCAFIRSALVANAKSVVRVTGNSLVFLKPTTGESSYFYLPAETAAAIDALLAEDKKNNTLVVAIDPYSLTSSCVLILEGELEAWKKRGPTPAPTASPA